MWQSLGEKPFADFVTFSFGIVLRRLSLFLVEVERGSGLGFKALGFGCVRGRTGPFSELQHRFRERFSALAVSSTPLVGGKPGIKSDPPESYTRTPPPNKKHSS